MSLTPADSDEGKSHIVVEESLLIPDAACWRAWLDEHEHASEGVWLVLAKKGTTSPTTLTYAEALDEALCSGWIDGPKRRQDEKTFLQRFTPRRRRSMWSQRNVGLVERLIEQGRMRPRGQAEIDRARLDGRWDRAYAGATTVEIPDDLHLALASSPRAAAGFADLAPGRRYSLLLPIITAAPTLRARRIAALVQRLENT